MGPLGNSFPRPRRGKKLLMVAGGIGIAPFNMIAGSVNPALLLYGAQGKERDGAGKTL